MNNKIYDVIIIGGGCAGISAAVYSASRGLETLLLDKSIRLGGLINNISNITHFTGAEDKEVGYLVAKRMVKQLEKYDIEVINEEVKETELTKDIKTVTTNNNTYQTKSVIIATGTTANELTTIQNNPLYSKVTSHNTYENSAKCIGQEVFVVGGSDGAAKEALFISQFAKKVNMIVLEDKLTTIEQFKNQIINSGNISVYLDSSIESIDGTDKLQKVTIKNNNTEDKKIFNLDNSIIFVFAGGKPNSAQFKGLELNNGAIITDENMETNIKHVYAVGDIRNKKVKQIATGLADGCVAAIHNATTL